MTQRSENVAYSAFQVTKTSNAVTWCKVQLARWKRLSLIPQPLKQMFGCQKFSENCTTTRSGPPMSLHFMGNNEKSDNHWRSFVSHDLLGSHDLHEKHSPLPNKWAKLSKFWVFFLYFFVESKHDKKWVTTHHLIWTQKALRNPIYESKKLSPSK